MTELPARREDDAEYDQLVDDVCSVIEDTRNQFAQVANAFLVMSYWRIGEAILSYPGEKTTTAQGGRPGLVRVRKRLAEDVRKRLPDARIALSDRSLRYAQRLVEMWAKLEDPGFGSHWLPKLSWRAHMTLIDAFADDPTSLRWYVQETLTQGWTARELRRQIKAGALQRRGAAPSNVVATLPEPSGAQAQEMINSPVLLPLLYDPAAKELELKRRIVSKVKDFMLALGPGLTFKGDEYPLPYDDESEPLKADLLFFNTKLLSWLVCELKSDKFTPSHAGQLSTYVQLVDEHLREPHHGPTIGLLLCDSKNDRLVKYALAGMAAPMYVTTYEFQDGHEATRRQLPERVAEALPPQRIQHEFHEALKEVGPARTHRARQIAPVGTARDDRDIQDRLLDGLMAVSGISAYEHSIYRTLIFSGEGDPRTAWRRHSLASIDARVGSDGERPRSTRHPHGNRNVRLSAKRLAERGLAERERMANREGSKDGRGTPYSWRTPDAFDSYREPASSVARAAIRRLSLDASEIGPTLETTLCRAWYAVERASDGAAEACHTRDEWAGLLSCSRNSVLPRLEALSAAEHLALTVELPAPKRRALRIRVRLSSPDFAQRG